MTEIKEKLVARTNELLDKSAEDCTSVQSVRLLNVAKDNIKLLEQLENDESARKDKKQNKLLEWAKIGAGIVGGIVTTVVGGVVVEVVRGKIKDRQIDRVISAEKTEDVIFTTSPGKSLTKF